MTMADLEECLQGRRPIPGDQLERYARFRRAIGARAGTATIYAIRRDPLTAERAWAACESE